MHTSLISAKNSIFYQGQVVPSSERYSTWRYSLEEKIFDEFFQVFLQQEGKNSFWGMAMKPEAW